MTYHLDIDTTLEAGIAEVASDQIGKAIAALDSAGDDLEEAVHDARKRFKKLRGLARLVRPGLGGRYQEINTFFRDLGRELSDVRDAQVLAETFDEQLSGGLDEDLHAVLIGDMRAWLDENRCRVLEQKSVGKRLEKVRANLAKKQKPMSSWTLEGEPAEILRGGLKKTYKRGRKALGAASIDPDADRLHEWRKRVKYHWYHCRLMREAWSPVMRAQADELDDLSDLLGDEHDVAVFVATVREKASAALGATRLKVIENAARARQQALREKAFRLGPKLFRESPSAHADRIAGYWMLARAELV